MKKAAVCCQDIVAMLLKTHFDIVQCNCFVVGGINTFSERCSTWKVFIAVIWKTAASSLTQRVVGWVLAWRCCTNPVMCVSKAWKSPRSTGVRSLGLACALGLGRVGRRESGQPGDFEWREGTSRNQHNFQISLTLLLLGPPPFC